MKIPIFTKFTFLKSHFSQNSPFWSLIFHKIHNSEISIFTKFTFLKSQFSKHSLFWNLIFHKIHNSEISFFTKFTFLKYHFFTKFTFLKYQNQGNFWIKSGFCPQCALCCDETFWKFPIFYNVFSLFRSSAAYTCLIPATSKESTKYVEKMGHFLSPMKLKRV